MYQSAIATPMLHNKVKSKHLFLDHISSCGWGLADLRSVWLGLAPIYGLRFYGFILLFSLEQWFPEESIFDNKSDKMEIG